VARRAGRSRDLASGCLTESVRHYCTIEGTSLLIVLLSNEEGARLESAVNGGRYALLRAGFFIIAIVAAVFGFGGIAATASSIAQILFFVFLAIFLITLVMGMAGRRRPPI
jgi:uncharacterized membrane protein YtjA (UPF0391 family)